MSNLSLVRASRFVLDLVYPPACALCGKGGDFLCDACEAGLPHADGNRCRRCWLPVVQPHCDPAPAFAALRSCYRYQDKVRKLVLSLKFAHQSSLAEPLGALMAGLISEHRLEADALVPVPLRAIRQRERGYNQAALLAREVGKRLNLPVLEVLQRHGNADAQALARTAEQRHRNVEGAFALRHGRDVKGRSLLLVDDVATTGATLEACARVLLENGASSVSAVTLARED